MQERKQRPPVRPAGPESLRGLASDFFSPSTISPQVAGPDAPRGADDTVAQRIGRYQIQDVIGRGGMGDVLLGYDANLGRELAVKVLQARHASDPVMLRRFLDEARLTGHLDHPGVPPVHEIGWLEDGRPYFSMRLVRGRTLSRLLGERQQLTDGMSDLLKIFAALCDVVAFAHSRGVIHRDLKPANVMVGNLGEVQLLDWGLGKKLGTPEPRRSTGSGLIALTRPASDPSLDGAALGTPAYMPPEQARWEVWRIDERADVFGLGAILCVLLTGEPPFCGEDPYGQACAASLADAYQRLKASAANRDLVHLAIHCLAGEPEARPRNGATVAGELQSCLAAHQARLRQQDRDRVAAETRRALTRQYRRSTLTLAVALCVTFPALCVSQMRPTTVASTPGPTAVDIRHLRVLLSRHRWDDVLAVLDHAQRCGLASAGFDIRHLRWQVHAARNLESLRCSVAHARLRGQNLAWANEAYRQRFTSTGLLRPGATLEDSADRLSGLWVRDVVLRALDDWAFCCADPHQQTHLIDLAIALDPDPWRCHVRNAAIRADRQRLRELAVLPAVWEQPAESVALLAWMLPDDPALAYLLQVRSLAWTQEHAREP